MLCKLILVRLRALFGSIFVTGGKKGMRILLAIVLPYCAITSGAVFYLLFDSLAETLCGTPFAWFYFALVGLISFGISFFFTAFTAKSELFEAKDNELLLSLPLHPRTILLSRLSILMGAEYLFSFLVMIPAGIAWGIYAGIGFLPLYILGCLSFPFLTAALASIVGWLLALLTAKVTKKTLMTVIFTLVFLGGYIYVYSNMQSYVNQILAAYETISERMIGWGFLFHWFGQGIAEGKILLLLAVLGIALVCFALAIWAISHGFLHIASSKPTVKKSSAPLHYKKTSVQLALLKREYKRFLSCPIYLLNCGLGLLLLLGAPIYLLVKSDLIVTLLSTFRLSQLQCAFVGALAVSAIGSTTYFTAPSISLEGKTLWILRAAPVDSALILRAKLYMHLSLTALPSLFAAIVIAYVLRTSVTGMVLLLIVPQLLNVFCAALGLMLNLMFPNFEWTNEATPVKQSLPVFLTMSVMMLVPILLIVGLIYLDVNETVYVLSAIALISAAALSCLLWLEKKGAKRFDSL